MRSPLASFALLALVTTARAAAAADYVVAENGDDDADGSMGSPWATLQNAADHVGPGDTVTVLPGSYAGFYLETSGTESEPIVWSAQDGVTIDEDNPVTPDGINIEGADHVVVEGFRVVGAGRAGIRAVLCRNVTIRSNILEDNFRWGILTGFCDDLLIERNEAFGSIDEHGIYVSNSGDRPVIRFNLIHDNNANGIHMNGDAEQGGDGVISEALVDSNIIFGNGAAGGSGINCDGVQDSRIVNNLVYDSHASGISLYQIDGGDSSTNNVIVNNTILVADDGRWALNVQDASTGNRAYNNIFLSGHPARGSINVSADSMSGFTSDFNVVTDRLTPDGDATILSLAQWRNQTGQDASSLVAGEGELFAQPASDDYHLTSASPATNAGTDAEAPSLDLDGTTRPRDGAFDIGAYEYCERDCGNGPGAGGGPPATGAGGSGNGSGSGANGGGGGDDPSGGNTPRSNDPGASGGCGCGIPGEIPPPAGWWLLAGIAALAARRRRRSG
jgi:MYXO-CTERM domain-containing protein